MAHIWPVTQQDSIILTIPGDSPNVTLNHAELLALYEADKAEKALLAEAQAKAKAVASGAAATDDPNVQPVDEIEEHKDLGYRDADLTDDGESQE